LAAVFVVALSESLAVVGLIVPGALLMVGAGALIGVGVAGFWSTMIAAVAGAVAGDGLSFWLGYHYRGRLPDLWPFRKHPRWLEIGERYFHRHGGKSVLFGRFVGPVRPFVPVVAGMLEMPPRKFIGVNVLSALAWAPAYLLPGIAFGASIALAGQVAVRLVVILLLLGVLTWLTLWSIHRIYLLLSPRAGAMTQAALAWGGRHPLVNRVFGGLLDPSRPEFRTLSFLAVLLIGAAWLFAGVLEDVVTGDPLVRVDQGVYQMMQALRTPWADRFMVLVTELGDSRVIGVLALVVLAWLLWRRSWRIAGYWAGAVVFGMAVAYAIKHLLQRPRPLVNFYDGISSYAFPSGHATMSAVVYGFLAVLVARNLPASRRWIAYGLAALLIGAIAVSRIYLGAHWLSDVLGGLGLGFAWVSLAGIAYYRHTPDSSLTRGLPTVALVTLVLAIGWHVSQRYPTDLVRYTPQLELQHRDAQQWWQRGWQKLPVYREDLAGEYEQPLNLQWSGKLDAVRERLHSLGWREPVALNPGSALHWLLPDPALAELPVLPQVHDGRHEVLLMIGPPGSGQASGQDTGRPPRQLVLRLWNSDQVLGNAAEPLWIGSVTMQRLRHILLLKFPETTHQYDLSLQRLRQSLSGVDQRMERRPADEYAAGRGWNGEVLLVRNR
jgi:undecaprenyl-diphosphatase